MASTQETVDFLLEQMYDAGDVRVRKMFGEYGLYCGSKFVGSICDDQLYLKQTQAGRDYLDPVVEGVPYDGAKSHFLISGDRCEDRAWLSELVKRTADELPAPKARPRRAISQN